MFNRLVFFCALALVAALGVNLGLQASTPTFWQVSTQNDFLKGEVENLSIDADGRLVLGPAAELVHETTAPFLWSLLLTPDGSLWAGSGNEGKVFHIDKSGQASTFFDAVELEVHAIAAGPNGSLYAGTSPDGKIYKITADGKSSVLFDPDDKYVWAIVTDRDGTVYAGTGEKGVIYRITPEGRGTVFYRTKSTHVTSLAFDGSGNLLAGTESPGKLFRIDRQGKAFVLLDSSFREIHAIRVTDKGVIYAAAFSGKPEGEELTSERPTVDSPRGAPIPTVTTEITGITILDVPSATSPQPATARRREDRSFKGAVYRVTPDGVWDTVWESADDSPYDLSFDAAGALLVGTGGKGKIFRITGDPASATLLTRAAAQQVTMFARDAEGRNYYATSNPGKIFRLTPDRAARGTYESDVRDAATVATWGSIRWRALLPSGAEAQLFTRSGNTETPDDTWSDWAGPYKNANGEQIASPKARYLQWKAMLAGRNVSPVLTSVTVAYLERNLRPEVSSINVHPPGVVFQKPFSSGELEIAGYDEAATDGRASANPQTASSASPPPPALGRRIYQKGLQTFAWKADDENEDRLQYDVMYRSEGETGWKLLKRGLWDPILVWDTSSVPDGTYVIKVVASDAPSNSPGIALAGELESTAFDIDNTPPRIEITGVRRDSDRAVASFVVRDAQSAVQKVEYSLDANRWRVIYPKDGIPDSRVEEFEIVLDGEAAARGAIIRASDAMNNSTTAVAEAGATRK
ncbi:MAG: hypothetical protein HYX76_09540 [Acidobacteria bacterium]|nr:hypothetical protein [Acidobacteriota bacterium]